MPKKVWYEIWLHSKDYYHKDTSQMIAKVRSPGLTNLLFQQIADLYKNKDVKLEIK